MHPCVLSEHRDYFFRNGSIEFENLLSPEECETLLSDLAEVLGTRMKTSPAVVLRKSAESLFSSGRDLWRDKSEIKRIVCRSRFAEIAASLTKTQQLRLGYDQFLIKGALPGDTTLQEMSCCSDIVCGWLLSLEKGSGRFLSPQTPCVIDDDGPYLLIVYTRALSHYFLEKRDPHVHALKKLGYVFGDKLRNSFHPIVFR